MTTATCDRCHALVRESELQVVKIPTSIAVQALCKDCLKWLNDHIKPR